MPRFSANDLKSRGYVPRVQWLLRCGSEFGLEVFAPMFAAAQGHQDHLRIQISGVAQPCIELVKQSPLKRAETEAKSLIMSGGPRFDPSPGSHLGG